MVDGRSGLLRHVLKEREGDGERLERDGWMRVGEVRGMVGDDEVGRDEELVVDRSRLEELFAGKGGARLVAPACGAVDVESLDVVEIGWVWLSGVNKGDAQSFSLDTAAWGLIGRMEVKSREEVVVFNGCGERGAK